MSWIDDVNNAADVGNIYRYKPKPAPKKKANFVQSLFPTFGGIGGGAAGGAVGGALAGSAILPGVGTAAGGLIGALLGGTAGGAVGKIAENKAIGKGAFNDVGKEALMQGALSAGPVRLLKAGKTAVTAGRGLTDALKTGGAVDAAAAKTGLVSRARQTAANTGEALKGEARGIKPGVPVPGTSARLKPSQSDSINQYLDTLGTKMSAHKQVRAVADDLKATGSQIGDLVKANDGAVKAAELKAIHASGGTAASKSIGLDAKSQIIRDTKGQVNAAKGSLSKLRAVRSNIDETLKNFYKQTDRNSATTAEMKVLKGYRDGIDKVLTQRVPGFKEANTRYATALKAQDLLLKSANPQGLRFFGVQTGVGGEGLQATKDVTGRAIKKVAAGGKASNPVGLKAITARSAPLGLAGAVANSDPYQSNSLDTTANPNSAMQDQNANTNITDLSQTSQDMSSASSPDSPFSAQNIETNVAKMVSNGATMKEIQAYLSMATTIQKLTGSASGSSGKLNSTQLQQANNAQSGLQSLQTIADTLSKNPNATKLSALPGGSLVSSLTGTGQYKAAVNNAVDVIGRLRSGGAINADEEKRFMALLPQTFDSPETAQYKLQQVAELFQRFANPQSAQPDASSLLTALGS